MFYRNLFRGTDVPDGSQLSRSRTAGQFRLEGTSGSVQSDLLLKAGQPWGQDRLHRAVPSGLDNLQGLGQHSLSGQPAPLLGCPHEEKFLFSSFNLCSLFLALPPCTTMKSLAVAPHWLLVRTRGLLDAPKPSLLQTESAQFPHPLLMGQVLQGLPSCVPWQHPCLWPWRQHKWHQLLSLHLQILSVIAGNQVAQACFTLGKSISVCLFVWRMGIFAFLQSSGTSASLHSLSKTREISPVRTPAAPPAPVEGGHQAPWLVWVKFPQAPSRSLITSGPSAPPWPCLQRRGLADLAGAGKDKEGIGTSDIPVCFH